MKITLIENGLDSLQKGYAALNDYEILKDKENNDKDRFSKLKDAILSIQHGIEILFKYLLRENNEILLFSEVNAKLREAYKKRKNNEITELFELDGVHTVSFKESIDRVSDLCGFEVSEKLKKRLLKVEKWRNRLTHSALVLNEHEVSSVLLELMPSLDDFFGPAIGEPYCAGQGRNDLDRAFRLFKAQYGKHENDIKSEVVNKLIYALKLNNIKGVTSPGVFILNDLSKTISILEIIQSDNIHYGCDLINLHCSGHTKIINTSTDGIISIFAEDTSTEYQFKFGAAVIYVPSIENSFSPLIFLYSKDMPTEGPSPYTSEVEGFTTQLGIMDSASNLVNWEYNPNEPDGYYEEEYDSDFEEDSHLGKHAVFRFITKGCVCFLNVQKLQYGLAKQMLFSGEFDSPHKLHNLLEQVSL